MQLTGASRSIKGGVVIARRSFAQFLALTLLLGSSANLAGGVPATQPAGAQHQPGKVFAQPRDPNADPKLIDLTNNYTLALSEDASGAFGYTLDAVPIGVQQFGNTQFDIRGIVQVSSNAFVAAKKEFPKAVTGIKVGQKCATLSFLHATRWTNAQGVQIGSYVVRYANGQIREIPIRFGIELRDWRPIHDAGANNAGPPIAWRGQDGNGNEIVLFQFDWQNPLPDVSVATIDMVSTMQDAAPFLVALTAN